MNTLLVVAHHRNTSLTTVIARQAKARLEADGHAVDLLDLHAEGFDPRMTPEDEPDWGDREKTYSAEVRDHMRRIDAADLIVVVFPVWWYGMPAILKGWIDRVWNYGFAYGRSKSRLAAKRMVWLPLAGESRASYTEHGLDEMLATQLRVAISNYCGITNTQVHFIYETLPENPADTNILATADTELAKALTP